jgi:hypothetical protein
MENLPEEFEKILKMDDEADKNVFFDTLFKDREASILFVSFLTDAINRLALVDRQTIEVRLAKQIAATISQTTAFFKPKAFRRGADVEGMREQVTLLNANYITLARLLLVILDESGDFSLSRKYLEGIDERDLRFYYDPSMDIIKIGNNTQSLKWKTLKEVQEKEEENMSDEEKGEKEADMAYQEAQLPYIVRTKDGWQIRAVVWVPISTTEQEDRIIKGQGETPEEALADFNKLWVKWAQEGGAGRQFPLEPEEVGGMKDLVSKA